MVDDYDQNEFVSSGKRWLIDNGIIDNHLIFDDLVLNLLCCSRHVKNVSLDIDRDRGTIVANIYMSALSFVFARKKKLIERIQMIAEPLSAHYVLDVRFFRHRKKIVGKDGNNNTQ